ncbi:alpha/beta fold hydrolase [Actinoallomurus iriomotensis]|uniref:Hydrolase n=1 Tax=Actinoallomurus iriomotensis TaxID=478107 RepID=A0A9W6VXE3_9ACTN|nr:alpha/beta hydrolase [Actinoallomurus iriomotensis]GLY83780.1 hydrolase [Actinoallomurus iriomotensis]
MPFSKPTNGFRLHYLRSGAGRPVVLVHGNPGDNKEYSKLLPLLTPHADVVVPDLRGYGKSDKHLTDVGNAYALSGQVDGVIALIDELGISDAVLCGYDVGSFTVQTIAVKRPDLAASLVIAPPTMGVGRRILEEKAVNAFLHAILYKTTLVEDLIDGKPDAVRAALKENLQNWSAPGSEVVDELLDHLTENHSAPGAFVAGVMWFRFPEGNPITYYANEKKPDPADRFAKPITILWPDKDPLFPPEWSDNLSDFYSDFTLHFMKNVGHFSPLEAPDVWAEHILEQVRAA